MYEFGQYTPESAALEALRGYACQTPIAPLHGYDGAPAGVVRIVILGPKTAAKSLQNRGYRMTWGTAPSPHPCVFAIRPFVVNVRPPRSKVTVYSPNGAH